MKMSAEYHREYYKRTQARRLELKKGVKRTSRVASREFVQEYLRTHPCVICPESDPVVLEFDHLDPKKKKGNVANMASQGYSLESLKIEISKCRVLCANCHRRETAKQQGWWNL